MTLKLEDYAMVGDCQSAALVGANGSVDWLCLPQFDSGACFAALLGTPDQGYWRIAPAGAVCCSRRRYRAETLILETDFETSDGAVTVVDCMPLRQRHPEVVRQVIGRNGTVAMRMDLVIRFDYGSIVPWVRSDERGLRAIAGPDAVILRTPVATRGEGLSTVAEFKVSAGEQVPFVLSWYPGNESPDCRSDPAKAIAATERWWRDWSSRCAYVGPHREAVVRSLITLRALLDNATGGMVAAPTTSLPEKLGGARNWDYRYCWLRDATFTLLSFLTAGYKQEAAAWRNWLLRAVGGSPAELQIAYSVTGKRRLTEWNVDWLRGYENSSPVRMGNAAAKQFQLDVYGEVIDLLYQCRRHEIAGDDDSWPMERAILQFLETNWQRPDDGIWEIRGPRRHFTHSKVMAWVAFDRAVKNVEQYKCPGDAIRWRQIRDAIHDEVCRLGFNRRLGSFTQSYGSEQVDASLLMMPLLGFLPYDDPRILGTLATIESQLMLDGFLQRYVTQPGVDGLPAGEGVFLPCSFWLADALNMSGHGGEASMMFERLLKTRNDLGLLSEEYDPGLRRLLGNFPQAFTHVSLINTAFNLAGGASPAEKRQS